MESVPFIFLHYVEIPNRSSRRPAGLSSSYVPDMKMSLFPCLKGFLPLLENGLKEGPVQGNGNWGVDRRGSFIE